MTNSEFSHALNTSGEMALNGQYEEAIAILESVDLNGVDYRSHAGQIVRRYLDEYTEMAAAIYFADRYAA